MSRSRLTGFVLIGLGALLLVIVPRLGLSKWPVAVILLFAGLVLVLVSKVRARRPRPLATSNREDGNDGGDGSDQDDSGV